MTVRDAQFVDALRTKTNGYLVRIEGALKQELQRYTHSRFYGPLMYAVEGGKRVRPLIMLLAYEAVGGTEYEHPLRASVAVELLHTESIIHDDIIDQQVSRREQMAFHVKYGYGASLLTADFILGIVLAIASGYEDRRVSEELASAATRMSEGELGELKIDPRVHHVNWEEYVGLVSLKTASLFQASAKIGAILGRVPEEQVTALGNYGLQLGIAFQVHDDVLDWGQEGKITEALALDAPGRDVRTYLGQMSRAYASRAKKELDLLPATEAKDYLLELADFSVTRGY